MKTIIDEIVDLDRREPPAGPITYEEFLDWADDKTFAEWVDGEVEIMSPVSDAHQEICSFLVGALRWHCAATKAGRAFAAPFQMRLQGVRSGREPDVMFVAVDHLDRVTPTYLNGPCDLAVEVVSPESVVRDRGRKYAEYELMGIPEYWIIDPTAKRTDFFTLIDGRYERLPLAGKTIFRSAILPGFWIDIDWLWQWPLPSQQEVAEAWGQGTKNE
jgi:Uma2 family endonuclease